MKLLDEYLKIMSHAKWRKFIPKGYLDPRCKVVPLRFVFSTPLFELWEKNMRKRIDIGSIWFREPIIGCPRGSESIGYLKGDCKNAETASKNIINWPCVVSEGWEKKLTDFFESVVFSLQ